MRRSGVEALIPRALAASALALVALASPTALAFALDADLHVVVPVSLHESIPVDLPVAGVVEAPPATADRMVDRAEAALFEPADAQQDPQEGSPEAGAQPQDAPAPILAAGIPLPLATVGAIPVLRDLGQPLPMGLGPLLEGAPAPAAAPLARLRGRLPRRGRRRGRRRPRPLRLGPPEALPAAAGALHAHRQGAPPGPRQPREAPPRHPRAAGPPRRRPRLRDRRPAQHRDVPPAPPRARGARRLAALGPRARLVPRGR